jgi:hypothetical protein
VNVVEPQPLVVGTDKLLKEKVGSTSVMVSDASSGAFSAKESDSDDGACETALCICALLNEIAGATIEGEDTITVAAMSFMPARVTAAVRPFAFSD